MADVAGDRLAAVRSQQFIDISPVDPDQDQHLIQRNRVTQGFERRSIQLDQREPFRALFPKRVERQRAVQVERLQGRVQVGGALLEAHETEYGEGVTERTFVVSHAIDQLAHAWRVCQDQWEHGRIASGDFLLRGSQPGNLGNQYGAVGVVGMLEPEILAPVQQHIGRGVGAE